MESSSQFLTEAHHAASKLLLIWATKTLKESSKELLKRQIQTKYQDQVPSSSKLLQVNIDEDDIAEAYRGTTRIARRWMHKLKESGEVDAARAVSIVCERQKFLEDNEDDLWKEMNQRREHHVAIKPNTAKEDMDPIEKLCKGQEVVGWKDPCELQSHGRPSPTMMPYPLLPRYRTRWMKQQSQFLDSSASRGNNEWARYYDWDIIRNSASKIRQRMHSIANTPQSSYEVIPRITAEEQTSDDYQTAADLESTDETALVIASSQTLTTALERKRKSTIPTPPRRPAKKKRPLPPPRPANTVVRDDTWSWSHIRPEIKESFGDALNQMIHEDDEEEETHLLQGALKEVGAVHLYNQSKIDSLDSIDEFCFDEKKLDKKLRMIRNKLRKERLGYPQHENSSGGSNSTKVLRVEKDGEEWMELDLGECMVQLIKEDGGRKTMYAFTSLEVSLVDSATAAIS